MRPGVTGEAVREARYEAAPAIAGVVAIQVTIAVVSDRKGWDLWVLPWWTWIVLVAPVVGLFWALLATELHETRRHRRLALAMLGMVVVGNAAALAALIGSLMTETPTGPELLLKAVGVWVTNIVTFGLWMWELDGGGPLNRSVGRDVIELQFPQDENPRLARRDWHPRLLDYVYVSLTNSIAFSPTDAMPLSARLKLVMAAETIVSVASTLLVAARAVNILR
jgi:hypothetical protein